MPTPPAIVLNSTMGDEFANSYVDLDYANAYWEQHWDVNSAGQWNALSDAQKPGLLVQACRNIETLRFTEPVDVFTEARLVIDTRSQQIRSMKTNFSRPQKYWVQQHLQFPRTLEVDTQGGFYIPEEIKFAQCEQAIYRLNLDPTLLANRLQGLSHEVINVGGVQISQKLEARGSLISPVALDYCKPYLLKSSLRLQRS